MTGRQGDEDTTPQAQPGDHSTHRHRIATGFATIRDLVTFGAGLGIVLFEVFGDRPDLAGLGAGLSLMGLPVALAIDEKRKERP